jgi:hydroxypyruvate isomerase
MLRFAANIGGGRIKRLFSECPFLERFDRAAAAGFEAVEFPEPYGEDVRAIRAALTRNGLRQVQFNLPWGDHAAGEVGIANNPGRRVEFRNGVSRALEVADQLGCPRLLCHVGITLPDVPLEAQRASVAENLRYAAEQSARAGVRILVEPLNPVDVPGFLLPTMAAARAPPRRGGAREPADPLRRLPPAAGGGEPDTYDSGEPRPDRALRDR